MNRKMKLTLLACALGAASATAQTSNDIPPPNDVIRLPGSVTTPNMPVVVSPPRDDIGRGTAAGVNGAPRQALPLVRSLGSDSNASGDAMNGTLIDGAATGGASSNTGTAASGGTGSAVTPGVNGATSSAGSGGPTDVGGVNGARSSAGLNGGIVPSSGGKAGIFDREGNPSDNSGAGTASGTGNSTVGNENNPSGNSTTVPAGRPGIPRTNGPAAGKGAPASGNSGGK